MRKLLCILLSLALLTLTSCGKGGESSATDKSDPSTSGGEYSVFTPEYEDVKVGIIKHHNHSTSVINEAEGFKSTDDFYLFLPHGTKISCDKELYVFIYNENFALDVAAMAQGGIEVNKMQINPVSDTVTLFSDRYVRLSVKGDFSDVKISVPSASLPYADAGNRSALESIPYIATAREGVDEDAVNYIFITDIHFGDSATSETGKLLLRQVQLAVDMANRIDAIDFVAIGGDTTTGMYETKEDAIKYTTMALEPLKNCKKPVFILMGNHDDNSYHRFTYDVYYPDRILSDKDWNDNILKVFCPDDIVRDKEYTSSKYYYYDLADKKTRVVCLDAIDYRAEYNAEGVISELPIKDPAATAHVSKYWAGTSWWGYSEGQINWLMNEALTAGEDWDYVFLSHMGIDVDTNSYGYATKNGKELRQVLTALQNHTSATVLGQNIDFSRNLGKVLMYQFGHIHAELFMNNKNDIPQVCTGTANPSQAATDIAASSISNKQLPWKAYDTSGTQSQMCLDLISVGRERLVKIGFGRSETFKPE